MKIEYNPIAVQNECLGAKIGSKSKELTVFIKMMGKGKIKNYYRTECETFPNRRKLNLFIKNKGLKVLIEKEFNALK